MHNKLNIICVDDDQEFLSSLELILTKLNTQNKEFKCQFEFLSDPVDALNLITDLNNQGEPIAMIIADQIMPKLQGIDLLGKIKTITPDTMTVLLTGYAGIDSAIKAINNYILDKYLTKPIQDLNDFIITLEHLLNEFHLRRGVKIKNKIIADQYKFVSRLNSIGTLKETLDFIIKFTRDSFQCDRISILLIEGEHLIIKAAIGLSDEIITETKIPIGYGLAGEVFKSGKPILVNNINDAPWLKSKFKSSNYNSFISMPILLTVLKSHSSPLGVINVTNKQNNIPFQNDDLERLHYISQSASIAISNQLKKIEQEQTYFETVKALAMAVEAKDSYLKGHSLKVQQYSVVISQEMKLEPDRISIIESATFLHDIGKIGISEYIINKPGKLSQEEYSQMQNHPAIGESIMKPVKIFEKLLPIIRHHHERYDGNGYPDRLSGQDIPLGARIVAVADTLDAMTSDRPYRQAMSMEVAIKEIRRCAGSQFDTDCVDALLAVYKKGDLV